MGIVATAQLILYNDTERPSVRIDGHHAYITWTTNDGRITVSADDAEALRRVSEAFAAAARLVEPDVTDPEVAKTLALTNGGAA